MTALEEGQRELLRQMRILNSGRLDGDDLEDVLPERICNVEELEGVNSKIRDNLPSGSKWYMIKNCPTTLFKEIYLLSKCLPTDFKIFV